MPASDFERFVSFANAFAASRTPADIDGDYYDQPGVIVYRQATHQLPDGGRVEVNLITPEASLAFAWEAEITINDKQTDRFIHLILQRDGKVVETYGKTILPVDGDRAAAIWAVLAELGAA